MQSSLCASTRCRVILLEIKVTSDENANKDTNEAAAAVEPKKHNHTHRARRAAFPPCTKKQPRMSERKKKKREEKDGRLTESKLTRAKMAKVETLSHTHLVLNG